MIMHTHKIKTVVSVVLTRLVIALVTFLYFYISNHKRWCFSKIEKLSVEVDRTTNQLHEQVSGQGSLRQPAPIGVDKRCLKKQQVKKIYFAHFWPFCLSLLFSNLITLRTDHQWPSSIFMASPHTSQQPNQSNVSSHSSPQTSDQQQQFNRQENYLQIEQPHSFQQRPSHDLPPTTLRPLQPQPTFAPTLPPMYSAPFHPSTGPVPYSQTSSPARRLLDGSSTSDQDPKRIRVSRAW